MVLRKLKRFEGAIANFEQALDIQSDYYAATRSKLFTLLRSGQIISYLTDRKTLAERERLLNDLKNVFDAFAKTKLPALVVIALVVLSGTHDRIAALTVGGIFLLITFVSDLINESQQ